MKEEKQEYAFLGRFTYLFRGGKSPRRHSTLMIALVLVALLAFVGPVSADNYYMGTPPSNTITGTATGDVIVFYKDTWNSAPDWNSRVQQAWANFTISDDVPSASSIQFARLYAVPYLGSMSADYTGNMTVKLYQDNTFVENAVVNQSLSLSYTNNSGASYASVPAGGYLINLSRVTSDYVAVFEVKPAFSYLGNRHVNVSLTSYNLTGRFDGRFKQAQFVYAYNKTGGSNKYYWLNNGHDPITKYIGVYTANQTTFSGVSVPATYTANLWVDLVAGNSTSGPGYGKYWWDGAGYETDISVDSDYEPVVEQGKYAGLNKWTWTNSDPILANGVNTLKYSRTNDYYKIVFSVLTIR